MTEAVIVVDVQRDFCSGGALAVPGGEGVVLPINQLLMGSRGRLSVYTRDWHPANSRHFQIWPMHCVQNTPGAEYHPDLAINPRGVQIIKGTWQDEDGFSAFTGRGQGSERLLAAILGSQGVRRLYVTGLATDYCVKATVLDACRLGFEAVLVLDAVRAVNLKPGDTEAALAAMAQAGARFCSVRQALRED